MSRRLVVFGRQGAGKGTQCKVLATHYGAPHISTGDMLREAVAAGTDMGRKAKEYMDAGALLPDDVMLGVIDERLGAPDVVDGGFLLDGFPRTLAQAEALLGITDVDVAVNIEVPEDLVVDRLAARRVCRGCGAIYTSTDEEARSGVCSVDGGEVVQRDDDQPDAIRARLAAYADQTLPVLGWFAERGLLLDVDGVGAPEAVTARLVAAIDDRLAR